MRKIRLTIVLLTPLLVCTTLKSQMIEETPQFDWTILFDGSTLDHWRGYMEEEIPSEWRIEDGVLAFTPGKNGIKNIITKKKYTNFILSLEWKISEAGNSGIFYGVSEQVNHKEPYGTGPEIQVLDNFNHPDGKYDTHTAGSLYDMIGVSRDVAKPVGQWNHCVVEVNHKTNIGKVSLNGINVYTFPVHGEEWEEMVANSKFREWGDFGTYHTGHIGLQDHGNKVWFRNIKIKDLGD